MCARECVRLCVSVAVKCVSLSLSLCVCVCMYLNRLFFFLFWDGKDQIQFWPEEYVLFIRNSQLAAGQKRQTVRESEPSLHYSLTASIKVRWHRQILSLAWLNWPTPAFRESVISANVWVGLSLSWFLIITQCQHPQQIEIIYLYVLSPPTDHV